MVSATRYARLLDARPLPISLDDLLKWRRQLATVYGSGLTVDERCGAVCIWTPGVDCGCISCEGAWRTIVMSKVDTITPLMWPMIVCPNCGNKRCPRAAHHDNTCTGSNDPGQEGSAYAIPR